MANYDPAARLKQHMLGMVDRNCSKADILDTLRLSRLIIEREKSAAEFPHLSLYCDWFVHGEIDKKALGSAMLERMNDIILQFLTDSGGIGDAVSRCVSLAQLRHEMTIFFLAKGVPTPIPDSYSNWKMFVALLLDELCDRPIRLPAKKREAEAMVKRMIARWDGQMHKNWPRAFFFRKDASKDNQITFMWNVEMAAPDLMGADAFHLTGAMEMTEKAEAFVRK
jgi:hypothetical protein